MLHAFALAAAILAPQAQEGWVPFTIDLNGQIRFSAVVNGRAAIAVLDTGVSHTILSDKFAASLGLKLRGSGSGNAIGGKVALRWATADSVSFGAFTRRKVPIGVTRGAGQERFGIDALIGSDLLSCCALDIDYDSRRFRILPSGRLPFTGETMPLRRFEAGGLPVAEIRIGKQILRPMIVDTGDGSTLTLAPAAWSAASLAGTRTTTTLGWGMGGPVITDTAILPGVAIAGIPMAETEARLEGTDGHSASIGAAGRIGSGLLMRFRVLMDYPAGRMVLRPAADFAAPPQRSTSGLLVENEGKGLRVLHVMRGSPAEDEGWRAGEMICAANGTAMTDPAYSGRWAIDTPGTTVRLTLCDGTRRQLVLRRFY